MNGSELICGVGGTLVVRLIELYIAIYCYILLYIAIMNGSELICGAEGTLVVPSDRAIYCYILLYIADYEWE